MILVERERERKKERERERKRERIAMQRVDTDIIFERLKKKENFQ